MMDKIRWGIVGCGDVTEVKSGPALQKTPHSSLVAVMRRSGELAKDYAERHGVPKWVDDADRLINDPEVNAVYVATPPSSHKELTIAALKAGKPVYVEKPMALDHRECLEMLDAARQAEQPLFVAYYRRALPRFLKVKALLEAEAIGEVRTVDVKRWQPARSADFYRETQPWRVDPSIAGGGYFVDLASHMLDLLDFLLGPIDAAQGYAGNQGGLYQAEDIVTGSFRFASGVQGTGSWCFSAFEPVDRTEIIGSQGMIRFATFAEEPVVLTTAKGEESFSLPNPAHIQQPLIETVCAQLRGVGRCDSTGESATRTSWVMDQMFG